MNAKTITSALIVAVLGFTLALPGTALAERGDRGHRQGHSQHDGHKYRQHRQRKSDHRQHKRHNKHKKRHYKRDHDRHYKGHNKHYAKRHYKGHNKHHYKHYGKHYGRHNYGHGGYGGYYYNDDDDDEKLLIGLVVGGILGYALNESQSNDVDEYDSYYQPNSYQGSSNATCLQEREYQTTVIVGGRAVDAYGTACLQPDGSWTRSPAVASY
jgi:hypothetical protein